MLCSYVIGNIWYLTSCFFRGKIMERIIANDCSSREEHKRKERKLFKKKTKKHNKYALAYCILNNYPTHLIHFLFLFKHFLTISKKDYK